MERLVALDIGSSSVRAIEYDEELNVIGEAREEYPGGPELDARALLEACARVAQREPDAISCFWHSLVAVDARGRPLTGVLTWRDLRSAGSADALARRLDPEEWHRRTGCVLHASYWPAKLAWLKAERPDVFASAARFVSFADLLVGGAETSVSLASGTGLLRLETRDWDDELLEIVGLDRDRLPSVGGALFPVGDGAAANAGAGCVTADRAAVTIGTSGALRTLHDGEARPRPGLFVYRLDARRVVEGGALSAGGNLYAWLERTVRLPEAREVADRPAGAGGVTFLTLLGGERSPGWDDRAKGAISGLTFDTTPLDLLQAGLEGVAYRFAEVAERMPEVREVVATGRALAVDRGWLQILADVLERPVVASGEPETSARGAGVLALEARGVEPPPPPRAEVVQPRAERFEAHRRARAAQRRLYSLVSGT